MRTTMSLVLFGVTALVTLGLVMLYSIDAGLDRSDYFGRQLTGVIMGLGGFALAASLDYQHLRRFSWLIYAVCLGLLLLVFVPGIGVHVKGSSRWVQLLGQRIQPSEFAKIGLVIMMAAYISWHPQRIRTFGWGVVLPALLFAPLAAVIFLEPDYGTTILLCGVFGVMLVVAGVKIKPLVPFALAALLFVSYSIYTNENRRERIEALFSPEATKQGRGLQAYQAKLAMGAAGWEGRGLGDGRQKLGRIPEHQTDFIFSVVGEELGLAGSMSVTAVYMMLIYCGMNIARYARDNFGTMLAVGITFLIGFQAFVNIGVVTGVLPNTGMALPFVSFGRSSLLAFLTAIGVLVSISRQASINPFEFEAECQQDGEIIATELS